MVLTAGQARRVLTHAPLAYFGIGAVSIFLTLTFTMMGTAQDASCIGGRDCVYAPTFPILQVPLLLLASVGLIGGTFALAAAFASIRAQILPANSGGDLKTWAWHAGVWGIVIGCLSLAAAIGILDHAPQDWLVGIVVAPITVLVAGVASMYQAVVLRRAETTVTTV